MPFQLKAKNICLTYSNISQQNDGFLGLSFAPTDTPNANSCLSAFSDFIRARADQRGVSLEYCVLGLERHESGHWHLHAGVTFTSYYRTRDAREFDIDGVHPSIENARSFAKWTAYVKKDGNFAESGESSGSKTKTVRVSATELIHLARTMNKLEFLAYCSVNRYNYAMEMWRQANPNKDNTITDSTTILGSYTPCLDRILTSNLWDKTTTLLLVGPSGIGKTTWSKKFITKPSLMVSHLDDLKSFDPSYHKSILFDDVSIKHLPDTSQIHLVDFHNPRSIHCRYVVARIPASIEKIFTCNTIPVNYDMEAISRRCTLIKYSSLY